MLSSVGALAVHLVTVAFERERVRDLFSRFVPETVVDEVLASADGGMRLGGVQREATVMFTDLRGFTSFAESLTPEQVIEVLNRYLTAMSDAILDHGGTLVAYMGDGIMAVFGAPIDQDDHADRALAAAREMLAVRLPRFNAWLASRAWAKGFHMGIGLNTGLVMSGNVGSERRVEYTAVGDTTNTAARIEELTKGTPHQLMFSGSTKAALSVAPEGSSCTWKRSSCAAGARTRRSGHSPRTHAATAAEARQPWSGGRPPWPRTIDHPSRGEGESSAGHHQQTRRHGGEAPAPYRKPLSPRPRNRPGAASPARPRARALSPPTARAALERRRAPSPARAAAASASSSSGRMQRQ